MKYLLLIAAVAAIVVDMGSASCFSCFGKDKMTKDDEPRKIDEQIPVHISPSPKVKNPSKIAEEYFEFFYSTTAAENFDREAAREKMRFLRNLIQKGLILNTPDRRNAIVTRWYALTQLTRCLKENDAKFDDLMLEYSGYKNYVNLIKYEKEIYKNVCVSNKPKPHDDFGNENSSV